jgi:alpha-glucosidase
VIYQVYPRSFADGDDDGLGDIAGIRSRLRYLADLGVDGVWINPWYPSPMADAGYDVADYRDVEPRFGTLAEGEALVAEAHALGLRVFLDIVPNHSSSEHAWFRAALASPPGSPQRARYLFRDGRGAGGDEPPNNWQSVFGGPAWTRVTEPDGRPGQWYLHLFDAGQPDFDWSNPEVRAEFEDVLRFWFDRGVDGFRIDVAHSLTKEPGLPDLTEADGELLHGSEVFNHPHWDRQDVHDVYRAWRALADSYDPPRVFVSEAWTATLTRMVAYVRPDELHTTFDFHFCATPWDAEALRRSVTESLDAVGSVGAPATWVLSNHDVVRHVSRLARVAQTGGREALEAQPDEAERYGGLDLALGRRRARAAALLMLALPGGAYVYQGEELGLEEVFDLPDELREDPVFRRTGGELPGRDGCRVPLPWATSGPSLGFGPGRSWLPQPASWAGLSVQAQDGDPGSMLSLYRRALRVRREHPALGDGTLTWLDLGPGVLAFGRDPGFACVVNVAAEPLPLPPGDVLLASGPLDDGTLPVDTAVWLAVDEAAG